MEKREASFIIDLQKVKIEKQQQTEKALNELLESFFRYLDKEVNIREKVRAREIFFYKTSLSKESIDDPTIAMHFKFWFGFDYVTVIGSRLFDIFIREKKKALSKPMLDISGFLMLMYLQPVTIIDSDSISLRFKSLLSAEDVTTEGCWFLGEKKILTKGTLALLRLNQVGSKVTIVGPPIVVDEIWKPEALYQLEELKKQHSSSIRKYLKEYGIDYLTYEMREG